ncbi:MAG: T9SS type A sorting domain-containing protein [Bacteroidales bacterium]
MKILLFSLIFFCIAFQVTRTSGSNWDFALHLSGDGNTEINTVEYFFDAQFIAGQFSGNLNFSNSSIVLNSTTNAAFVAKVQGGNLIWANKIGGTIGTINGSTIDTEGNFYVIGAFDGICTFYSQNPADNVDLISAGDNDGFIAKYDGNGNLIFAWQVGQSATRNRSYDAVIDDNGNIYVGGFWRGGTITFSPTITLDYSSSYTWSEGYLVKYLPDGQIDWVKHLKGGDGGATRIDGGLSIGYNQDIIASGAFRKSMIVDAIEVTANLSGTQDQFLISFSQNGTTNWIRTITNASVVSPGNTICTDPSGIYASGTFNLVALFNNSTGLDPYSVTTRGAYDGFIAKYNYNGDIIWLKQVGGTGNDKVLSLNAKNSVLSSSGYFSGTTLIGESIPTQDTLVSQGFQDGFLINYSTDGIPLSSVSLGGSKDDETDVTKLTPEGNSIIGGYFLSPLISFGSDEFENTTGTSDGFLAKHINIHILPTISEITCSDANDGALRLEVFGGGQEPYTYELSKVNGAIIGDGTYTGTLNFADLESGVYRFVVTDALSRTVTKFYHLVAPEPIVINETVINVTGCYGNENGEISLSVLGGVGDYTYFWDTPNGYGLVPNAQNQSTLTAGTYIVTVTDANGCIATESFEILQPAEINFGGSIVTNNASSNPLNPDGSVNLIINNGVAPYTCSWKGPNGFTSTDQSLAGIRGGTYILSLQDTSGCKTDTSFNIGDKKLFNAIITQTTNPKCKGGNDGTATVDFENITGGISIVWSNEQTDVLTATNLSVGHYSVTLTDDMGTPSDTIDDIEITLMPVLIGEPDFALGVAQTVTKTTCPADSNGSIQLTVNGWSQPYNYEWATTDGTGLTIGDKDQFDLTIGSYSYIVTDKYGCAVGSSVNLSSNYSAPSFTFDVSPSNNVCEGTEVVFSTSVGFSYQFYINDVPQGDFSSTNTLTITEPADGMRVKAVGMNTAGCSAESAEITLTVTPNVGIPTFTSGATTLCSGTTETYVATADDAESIVYSIESGTAVVEPSTGKVTNIDADFTIRATANGFKGCGEKYTDLEVTVNPIPQPVISTIDNIVFCSGDLISVEFTSNIQNADAYQWFKDNVLINGANQSTYITTESGNYSVEVTENGCSGLSNALEVVVNPLPVVTAPEDFQACNGETITLTATGNATSYEWDNSVVDGVPFIITESTTYTVTGTNTTTGCSATDEVVVTVNPIPEPVISTIDNLSICTGDDINVEFTSNISGAENYQWFKNNEVITGANESSYTATTIGIYSLEVTENGCSGLSNELEIIQIDRPEPIISTADPLEWIEGESISVTFTVDIADADAYQWIADGTPIPGANTASFEATAIGEYSVLVTKGSCQGESNVIAVTIETIPHYNVMFKVESKGGNPIVNVKISVAEFDPIVTNEEGVAVLSTPKGDFNFQAVVAEYNTFDGNFTVNDKDVSVNIVMVPLGIAEDGILSVKLYPNPFSNEIKISDSELVTRVVITSISGQKVMDVNLEGINRINTQNLPAGVYLLKLYTQNGESKVFRMVKDQQ